MEFSGKRASCPCTGCLFIRRRSVRDPPIWTQRNRQPQLVQAHTDQWVRNRVLIDRAVFNLGDEVTDIDELVDQYREDLLKYRYQEAMLQKLLDTAITEQQILDYFEANSANFELKENIVRAAYLVTVPQAPDLKEARKMLKSGTREDLKVFRRLLSEVCSGLWSLGQQLDVLFRAVAKGADPDLQPTAIFKEEFLSWK